MIPPNSSRITYCIIILSIRINLLLVSSASIACGAKFLFNSANHTQRSLSTYPFPLFFEEWGLDIKKVSNSVGTIKAIL